LEQHLNFGFFIVEDQKMNPKQWNDLVHSTKAIEVCRLLKNEISNEIVTLDANATIREALQVFLKHNILSCPILEENYRFLGFVDVLDIVCFACRAWKSHLHECWTFGDVYPGQLKDATNDSFFETEVNKIVNFSGVNEKLHLNEDSSLVEVLDQLAPKEGWRPHRLAILDKDNHLVNVLTQMDLVRFAKKNLTKLPRADETMEELGMLKPVIQVPYESTVFDVVNILHENSVSAVGLQDREGKLVANFSASDLRGIDPEKFDMLTCPAVEFLELHQKRGRYPITCKSSSTLRDILPVICSEKIHRMYIVDEEEKPIGLVSLTDIIPLLQPDMTVREPKMQQAIISRKMPIDSSID
jgi:CBS-domain-containing membrane protein